MRDGFAFGMFGSEVLGALDDFRSLDLGMGCVLHLARRHDIPLGFTHTLALNLRLT